MAGIKETKELVGAIVELANATDKAAADGIGITDIVTYVPSLMLLPEALAGIGEVKAEIKDLDAAEIAELSEMIKSKLDLTDDSLEGIIEDALSAGVVIMNIVGRIKAAKAA